jgi:ribosomal protein S12 methylthiotransferase
VIDLDAAAGVRQPDLADAAGPAHAEEPILRPVPPVNAPSAKPVPARVPRDVPAASKASRVTVDPGPPSVHTRPTWVGRPPRAAASKVKVTEPLAHRSSQPGWQVPSSVPSSTSTESISPGPKLEAIENVDAVTPSVLSAPSSKSSNCAAATVNGRSPGDRYGVGPKNSGTAASGATVGASGAAASELTTGPSIAAASGLTTGPSATAASATTTGASGLTAGPSTTAASATTTGASGLTTGPSITAASSPTPPSPVAPSTIRASMMAGVASPQAASARTKRAGRMVGIMPRPGRATAVDTLGHPRQTAPIVTGASQNIYFVSLGCPKNQVDTELMLGQVTEAGHALVDDPETADVIVVNTCAFIDSAKAESVNTILEMAEYKKGRAGKLVVTGCLAQRYADEIAKEIPEIDHILGSSDFPAIAATLTAPAAKPSRGKRALPMVQVSERPAYIYDHDAPRVRIGARHTAYVKIAEGCDRPCAFCIIPKLRGPQRSRPIADIAAEVAALAAAGTKEICLIAQDLTRYGWDLDGRPTLAELLHRLAPIPGVHWIRLHYTFPSAFTDELIDAIATLPTVAKYVDVPLQHIDDGMLKLMRRGHSTRVTYELLERLRTRIPGVVIRSTFISGHPGETEASHAALRDFLVEAQLDRVGVFPYSVEPGTVSAVLPNRVPAKVADARVAELMELQRGISRAKLEGLVGRELEVLVDGVSEETDLLLEGRYYGQAPGIDGVVYLADGTAPIGALVRARITQAADHDLAASLEL